jgi:hypothetical protein
MSILRNVDQTHAWCLKAPFLILLLWTLCGLDVVSFQLFCK